MDSGALGLPGWIGGGGNHHSGGAVSFSSGYLVRRDLLCASDRGARAFHRIVAPRTGRPFLWRRDPRMVGAAGWRGVCYYAVRILAVSCILVRSPFCAVALESGDEPA